MMRGPEGKEQTVTVARDKLLDKLRENRKRHVVMYEEACQGYMSTVATKLRANMRNFGPTARLDVRNKRRKLPTLDIALTPPVNRTVDYDRAIALFEWQTVPVNGAPDEIVLTETQFRAYVLDEWPWRDVVVLSNSAYSGTARAYAATFAAE